MMKVAVSSLILLAFVVPTFGKAHIETYPIACTELWPAVKDVLRNSGNYGIVSMDNTEMMASYNFAGAIRQRTNSVLLNAKGTSCEMQIQSSYRGIAHDDAGDFKKRVDEALVKLKGSTPADPAKPADTKK
jgi:hypothetical protein